MRKPIKPSGWSSFIKHCTTETRYSMSTSTVSDLLRRHGDHHFINVKYGRFIFLLSLIHITYLWLSRKVYLRKWITSGRSTTWRRLVAIPDLIFLVVWGVVLTVALFWKFEVEQITAFIKRFGRFAYVLLPFDIFISLKPNPLPDLYYLELIFLHKWISRIIVGLAFIHSVGFVTVWLKRATFFKMFRLLNFFGVISITGFLVVTAVSLKVVRRRAYKLFFSTHLILAWIAVALLEFHSRPGVGFYTCINVALFITQIIAKLWKSKNVEIQKFTHPKSGLELVQLTNVFSDSKNFTPGSHLRLSYPKTNVLNYVLPSHPFTISSRPDEKVITLVAKKNRLSLETGETYSVFGPFPTLHQNFFKTADQVLLIAGGSGISFVLGIYSELTKNSSVNVSLIWVLKNEADLWILEHFSFREIDVYVTGSAEGPTEDGIEEVLFEENGILLERSEHDSFELDEMDPFDDTNQVRGNKKREKKIIKYGRPKLSSYANRIEQYDKSNNWIVSCGTQSLNASCQKLANSLKVRYHGESYDL